jgi:uncharacterized protein (TIGR03067 family)
MRTYGLMIGVVAFFLAAAFPRAGTPTRDIEKMQGTWVILSVEMNGQKMGRKELQDAPGELTLNGNHYLLKFGEIVNAGTFKLDSEKLPRTVNVIPGDGPNRGRLFPGIYTIEGDFMKTCFNVGGGDRPTEFTTKDQPGWVVVEQKRRPGQEPYDVRSARKE